MASLQIGDTISIPLGELTFSFSRSGGAGGQNVNKVSSKVTLRFDLRHSPSVPEQARARALRRLVSRITEDGQLVLSSDVHREQARNRAEVVERFTKLLADAVRPPKRRVATRPSAGARERRLGEKKARGKLKEQRRRDVGE